MPAALCLLNGRCLGQRVTGVQRYVYSLLPHLRDRLDIAKPKADHSHGTMGHVWEQFILPRQTKGRLLWSPGNTGPLAVARQVVTVHDASTLDHPEWFEGRFARWYRFLLPRLMRRAHRVITVSEFSRQRLLAATGLPEDKIVAIPNGINPNLENITPSQTQEYLAHRELNSPYLLCVASLEPRKNLRRLFTAWQQCRTDGLELVVAGTSATIFRDHGFEQIPPHVRLLGHVDDTALAHLYSGALGFVFPSVYEGFGLPPLEAMAHGCPVLTSHATALPEVCGPEFQPDQPDAPGAVLYFDPFQPESIAETLTRFLHLPEPQCQRMTTNGLQRSRQFSWQHAAEQTWQVLAEAAAA